MCQALEVQIVQTLMDFTVCGRHRLTEGQQLYGVESDRGRHGAGGAQSWVEGVRKVPPERDP